MLETKLRVKNETLPERCEVCHKADCFDPQTGNCTRCSEVSNNTFVEKINKNRWPIPIPSFLRPRINNEQTNRFHLMVERLLSSIGKTLQFLFSLLPRKGEENLQTLGLSNTQQRNIDTDDQQLVSLNLQNTPTNEAHNKDSDIKVETKKSDSFDPFEFKGE